MEDRLSRIEHITAGIAEQRKQDREEYRQLWRDTQRQIAATNATLDRFIVETRERIDKLAEADERLGQRIESLAKESREADQRLGDRIESLVSAIGEFIRESKRPHE